MTDYMQANTIIGGVEILPYAGASTETINRLSGRQLARLVSGKGVPMVHWKKYAGTISGSGWTPPGVDSIPTDVPVELYSIKIMSGNSTSGTLETDIEVRPDVDPWVEAYDRETDTWTRGDATASTVTNAEGKIITTLTAVGVAGDVVRFNWMPKFTVFVTDINDSQDSFSADWGWSISWEEL